MADYTKREQRAADIREALARETDTRYTIFSNDFDPILRTPDLTLGQAIRVLQSRTGCTVYFEQMDHGLGVGFRVPHDASQIAPTAGSVRVNIVSRKSDRVEAKKELVLACILVVSEDSAVSPIQYSSAVFGIFECSSTSIP